MFFSMWIRGKHRISGLEARRTFSWDEIKKKKKKKKLYFLKIRYKYFYSFYSTRLTMKIMVKTNKNKYVEYSSR